MTQTDEQVLCFKRDEFAAFLVREGLGGERFVPAAPFSLGRLVHDHAGFFAGYIPRSECEGNPAYRQLCTYSVIRLPNYMILTYERGTKAGEPRLHTRRSIGVGGHVNIRDTDEQFSVDALYRAGQREVLEEIDLGSAVLGSHYAGLLNDEADPVGRDHLGLVFDVRCSEVSVRPKDAGIVNPVFVNPRLLSPEFVAEHEGWSRILLQRLVKGENLI